MAEEKKFYSNFNSVLVARGVLDAESLEAAVQEAGKQPLDRYLIESGKVDPGKLLLAEGNTSGTSRCSFRRTSRPRSRSSTWRRPTSGSATRPFRCRSAATRSSWRSATRST